MRVRTAYKCRAYPDEAQQAMLSRTFGCVRVVWNRTLAARRTRWRAEGKGTSYAETDRALTAMKRDPDLKFLNEVPAVPLQQALRHQQAAFTAFWEKRARYPRFKSRASRQSASYTRAAFRIKDGALYLAKMSAPLRFVWSWPDVDPADVDPTSVTMARDSAGRWFVTFHVDALDPEPRPATGQSVGVDMGLTHFAVLSTGEKVPHPRDWERHERQLKRWQRRLARCQRGSANHAKRTIKVARVHARVTDARRDFLHKISTRLVRENDVISVEDLKRARYDPQPAAGPRDFMQWLGGVPVHAGVQGPAARPDRRRCGSLVSQLENLLGMRAPACRLQPEYADVAVPVLRRLARPGCERREEHSCRRAGGRHRERC